MNEITLAEWDAATPAERAAQFVAGRSLDEIACVELVCRHRNSPDGAASKIRWDAIMEPLIKAIRDCDNTR